MTVPAVCLRCGGESDTDDDLVCTRCSQTRVRAALPSSQPDPVEPPFSELDVSLLGDMVYDEQLERVEAAAGETAWGLVVRVEELMGMGTTLTVLAVLAPNGPATPREDLWGDATVVARVTGATRESVRDRIAWARHTSQLRRLQPVVVEERRAIARPGFRGDGEGLRMLLAARLRLATLSFEGLRDAKIVARTEARRQGEALLCEALVDAKDGRAAPLVVELFSCEGSPKLDPSLVVAAMAFARGDR